MACCGVFSSFFGSPSGKHLKRDDRKKRFVVNEEQPVYRNGMREINPQSAANGGAAGTIPESHRTLNNNPSIVPGRNLPNSHAITTAVSGSDSGRRRRYDYVDGVGDDLGPSHHGGNYLQSYQTEAHTHTSGKEGKVEYNAIHKEDCAVETKPSDDTDIMNGETSTGLAPDVGSEAISAGGNVTSKETTTEVAVDVGSEALSGDGQGGYSSGGYASQSYDGGGHSSGGYASYSYDGGGHSSGGYVSHSNDGGGYSGGYGDSGGYGGDGGGDGGGG